jgi:hypothetical protein
VFNAAAERKALPESPIETPKSPTKEEIEHIKSLVEGRRAFINRNSGGCAETQIEVSCVRPALNVFTNIKEELTRRRIQA